MLSLFLFFLLAVIQNISIHVHYICLLLVFSKAAAQKAPIQLCRENSSLSDCFGGGFRIFSWHCVCCCRYIKLCFVRLCAQRYYRVIEQRGVIIYLGRLGAKTQRARYNNTIQRKTKRRSIRVFIPVRFEFSSLSRVRVTFIVCQLLQICGGASSDISEEVTPNRDSNTSTAWYSSSAS